MSKPGSQVRFIGLVLLPLFEALGELLPELIDFIIIPVRVALDFYKYDFSFLSMIPLNNTLSYPHVDV